MSSIKSTDWPKAGRKCGQGYQTKKTLGTGRTERVPDKPEEAEDNYAALRKDTEPCGWRG